jgi:hypothetical protein
VGRTPEKTAGGLTWGQSISTASAEIGALKPMVSTDVNRGLLGFNNRGSRSYAAEGEDAATAVGSVN